LHDQEKQTHAREQDQGRPSQPVQQEAHGGGRADGLPEEALVLLDPQDEWLKAADYTQQPTLMQTLQWPWSAAGLLAPRREMAGAAAPAQGTREASGQ
jgi:hypothetical protein